MERKAQFCPSDTGLESEGPLAEAVPVSPLARRVGVEVTLDGGHGWQSLDASFLSVFCHCNWLS